MTTMETAIVLLILTGAVFMVISAIGIVRLPDVFSRMHAAGKASTLGISCILLGAGFFFPDEFLFYRMIVLIALIFATAPISTTALARAVYHSEPSLRRQLKHDEMAASLSLQDSSAEDADFTDSRPRPSVKSASSTDGI